MTVFGLTVLGLLATFIVRGKKGVKLREKVFSKAWWLPFIQFVVAVGLAMDDLQDIWLYDQLIGCFVMSLFFILPASVFYNIYLAKLENEKFHSLEPEEDEEEEELKSLPNTVGARRNIVEKINNKYQLNLTGYQIDLIVNCSFQMPEWYSELQNMDRNYDSIYQWFSGETDWLRAYLRAFAVQDIVPDMKVQKQICLNAFEVVFNSIDMTKNVSIHDCVREINDKNYTNFDDITFMVAYRMLEENGKKYKLPTGYIPRATNDIDELLKKYSNSEGQPGGGTRRSH